MSKPKQQWWALKVNGNLIAALNEIRQIDAKDCPFDIYQIADDAILKERYRDWAKWDGEYRKTAYLVRTKNGETYGCWPNAGKMVCIHKHGHMEFTPDDESSSVSVRRHMICHCCVTNVR